MSEVLFFSGPQVVRLLLAWVCLFFFALGHLPACVAAEIPVCEVIFPTAEGPEPRISTFFGPQNLGHFFEFWPSGTPSSPWEYFSDIRAENPVQGNPEMLDLEPYGPPW